ncbi:Gfo/Idh/MocA family protein [Halalkalicoccus subterraneus]|uniref:Gfo/Idh/MocA family protein n=1 Tax=Halalkalicoccus subterraneus TaxID=2675002 RepID=UPI000EFC46AD|nr:Gfo/Idh/MocA family oxidoreductase [Halalkalicoccus subterraneus]
MINVGIIGLDTSHSEKFAELLSDRSDTTVRGVWDGGDVRSDAYTEAFCRDHRARRYDRPEEMIDHVDAVMVLTVDWDRHRPIAVRFLEAGVPTFVDKPIAGSIDDVEALRRTVERNGTPFYGGSAVPYHPSLAVMRGDDGTHDLFAAGYNDPFYYGVHITDTARTICGADWTRIVPVDHGVATTVTFADGSSATLRFDGPTENPAFGVLDVGGTTRTARIDGTAEELDRMYDPFIETFVETARGDRDESDRLFDAATLLLGVQATLEFDVAVTPENPLLADVTHDGGSFTETYEPFY